MNIMNYCMNWPDLCSIKFSIWLDSNTNKNSTKKNGSSIIFMLQITKYRKWTCLIAECNYRWLTWTSVRSCVCKARAGRRLLLTSYRWCRGLPRRKSRGLDSERWFIIEYLNDRYVCAEYSFIFYIYSQQGGKSDMSVSYMCGTVRSTFFPTTSRST